jgi:hypothetical protein
MTDVEVSQMCILYTFFFIHSSIIHFEIEVLSYWIVRWGAIELDRAWIPEDFKEQNCHTHQGCIPLEVSLQEKYMYAPF